MDEKLEKLWEEVTEFLRKRGIHPGDTERLIGYLQGDGDRIVRKYPQLVPYAGAARWRADISDGILIVKYPVPGVAEPILPQFRPFGRKLRRTFSHDHAMFTAKMRALHVRSVKWDHGGQEREGEHPHQEFYGKYLLFRGPRERYTSWHDVEELAARMRRRDPKLSHRRSLDLATRAWEEHVKSKHGGTDTDALHEHEGSRPDPNVKPEMRLDMHPRAAEMLPTAGRAFFSIEGSIKADALLSAGECSFAVPSVTMWRAPELDEFADRYLREKLVYIVADLDWAENPQVALQAFECREYLRRIVGPNVHVAAAPAEAGVLLGTDKVKGVDDYLGAGGKVDELRVLDREMSNAFHAWRFKRIANANGSRGPEAAETDANVLGWMALHASSDGVVLKAAPIIARYLGLTEKTIGRAVARLVADGSLIANATPEMLEVRERYIRVRRDGRTRRRPLAIGESWDPQSEFTIPKLLRADEDERQVGTEGEVPRGGRTYFWGPLRTASSA